MFYLHNQLYPGFYVLAPNDFTKVFNNEIDICSTRNIYCSTLLKKLQHRLSELLIINQELHADILQITGFITNVIALLIYIHNVFKDSIIIDIPQSLVWILSRRIISQTTNSGNRNWT